MGLHKDITVAKGIHISHAFTFADATARNGATGLVAADEGKIARQTDDDSFYVLQDSTGPTWASITETNGAPVGAEYVVISLDATLTAERRLQAEASVLSLTDAGANADVTIGVLANGISNAKLRDSAGTSVMGKATSGTGDPADIVAGVDNRILSRAAGVLAFTLVATAMLADGAVTFAKMQDITTDRLVGRDTAATGDPEEITVAGGLEFTGSGGIQRSALTGDVTAGAGSNATTIAANAVTDTKLRDSAGTSVIGKFDSGTGDPADIVAASDTTVLQRLGGSLSFSALTILPENLALTGDITPSTLSLSQNNYTPSGAYATASTVRQASSANVVITGLTGGADGRVILFHNIGTFNITLKNEDSASTAGNRFALSADLILQGNEAAFLQYDSTSTRWRLAAHSASGSTTPAPAGAEYVVVSLDGSLTAERRLQAEASVLTLIDGGANGDITITVAANGISNAKLRDSAGTSVIGKATAGSGDPADIAASVDDRVLARSGGTLSFQQISTAMVADNAINFAKLQNITTDRLIGRDTAATGDPEEITVAGGLEFTGAAGIQRSALTGDVTAGAGSNATTIAANAVSNTKLRDSVGTSVIGKFDSGTGDPADIVAAADGIVLQRTGGSLSFSALTILSENLALTGDITPSSLAANQNNYTPSGAYTTASTLRQASSANVDITGLTGGSDGRIIIFHNIGSFDITLKTQNGSSTAANRFALNADVVLAANNSALLQYDSTSLRWRAVATSIEGAGGGGAPVGAEYVVVSLDGTLTAERRLQVEASVLDLTDGGANGDITIGVLANGISNAKLRDSVARSVIGRSAATTGDPADIAATVDGQVLRRAGTTIGFGTIATAGIADEAVTFAKLQHIATDRLIGRDTAATGDPEEITVAGGLEFTGAGGIQRTALTGDVTAGAGSNATTIAANAVTFAKMQDITGPAVIGKTGAGAGDPAEISAGVDDRILARAGGTLAFQQVSTAMVADNAISFAKIQNITSDRLVGRDTAASGDPEEISVAGGLEFTGSVGIQRSALTGDVTAGAGSNATTIAADAVTFAKMQNIATDRLIGRDTAATGDPEEITVGGGLEFTGSGGIQRSALTGDVTAGAGSNATTIAANAVSNTKLRDSIGTSVIGKATSGSGDPADIAASADNQVLQRTGGTLSFSVLDKLTEDFALTGDISPAALAVDTNDFAPTGLATASIIRLTASAVVDLTGLTGGADGRIISIYNIGSTNAITLTNNDAGSAADNRFDFGRNIILAPKAGVTLIYDDVPAAGSKRWRAIGLASDQLNVNKIFGADGAIGNPTYRFSEASGMYLEGPGILCWSVLGTDTMRLTATQLESGVVGTAAVPARCWRVDRNTGEFRVGSNAYGISAGGELGLTIDNTPDTPNLPNVVVGQAALAAAAVRGFFYIPTTPGPPTGTPVTFTGREPINIDDTNDRFDFRSSSAWHQLDPTAILNQFLLPADITPTSLAAQANNYAPTGFATTSTIRQTSSVNVDITGLAGGADGRIIIFHNIGSNSITLKDENASSTAANRFALNADVVLAANNSALLQYDSTSLRWRVIASSIEEAIITALSVTKTDTGNVGVGEDDLHSFTVPADTLNATDEWLEVEFTVTLAANANSKQIRVKFGTTLVFDSTAQTANGGSIHVKIRIVRTGSATQRIIVVAQSDNALFGPIAMDTIDGTEDLTATVVLKATGEAVSDDDIVSTLMTVKHIPAP